MQRGERAKRRLNAGFDWRIEEGNEDRNGPRRATVPGALALSRHLTGNNAMGGGVRHSVGLHLRIALQKWLDRVHDAGILIALVRARNLFFFFLNYGKV